MRLEVPENRTDLLRCAVGMGFAISFYPDTRGTFRRQDAPGAEGNLMNTIKTMIAALTLASFALLMAPSGAEAKPLDDHLACFKIKDSGKARAALDMLANEAQIQYSVRGCKMKAKADKFCVPATKIVTHGQHNPIGGQRLENDFLCYKLRCEAQDLPNRQWVIDQFGRRQIGKFKPTEICTPAWKLDITGSDVIPVNPSPLD